MTKLIRMFVRLNYFCPMLRKAAGILFAFVIVSQSLMNLGLYTYYNLNKKMIAEKLCVNKNNPKMHCEGHCFLSKQLKQLEEKEKQQSQTLKEKEEQVIATHDVFQAAFIPPFIEVGMYYPFLNKDITPPFAEFIPPPDWAA